MSEKDKMLAGELYDANYDEELIKERFGDNVFIAPNCGFYTAGNPCRIIKEL